MAALDRLRLTYGLRLDANRIPTSLPYNGAVDSVFRVRTDFAPSGAAVSPRASFQWGIGNNGTTGIPGYGAPWGFLTGGFGEFRNDLRPGLIAPVLANDGLDDGTSQLLCIGAAVPTPNYAAYMQDPSSIPTSCAAGTNPSFVSSQPNVWLIDPSFQSQRSWRGNLGHAWSVHHEALPLFRRRDLLAEPAPAVGGRSEFRAGGARVLASEGDRPVFASSSSIVPATGQVTNVDSRFSPQFGSVNALLRISSRTARSTRSPSTRSG